MLGRSAAVLLLLASVAACGDGGDGNEVVVFAAASFTEVMAEWEAGFEAQRPDVDVRVSLAGSSSLREQILDGAPVDVFVSANEANMDALVMAGVVSNPLPLAETQLEIAVPAGNPGGVEGLEDFSDGDLLIGLCAAGVPCGDFARRVLERAGVDAAVDTEEADVRSLVTKLIADELDAGLVYRTDVLAAGPALEGIAIPARVNVGTASQIATLDDAPNPLPATDFVSYVRSDAGRAVLVDFGFEVP